MADRSFHVDTFRPNDAEGVARLFAEVYGDGYPVKIVYDPGKLITAFENHENIPAVARTPENEIVGYSALYRSAPNKHLYEIGQAMVRPDYRNTAISGLLFRGIIRIAKTFTDIDAFFAEAVCSHLFVQRAGVMFKTIETAIEIDLMPAEAYEQQENVSGRVSTLNVFRTFTPKPQTIYVPAVYGDYLRYIYADFDDSRTFAPAGGEIPQGRQTEIDTQIFDFARVARVAMHETGLDFTKRFDREEKEACEKGAIVLQVWLKLSWPWIDKITDALRSKGYFFGGALPHWFGEDGLLMQKILEEPNWKEINLYTEKANKILEFVKNDFMRVKGLWLLCALALPYIKSYLEM